MVTLHNLCHCSINNPKLARKDHFSLMTISGHKTTSVSRRYNVVTDAELQDVNWKNNVNSGVHMSVNQPRKMNEIVWYRMLLNFLKTLETLMELPEFIMENEELGSFVRRREWIEKWESNPRLRAWEARTLPTELFSLKEIWQGFQCKTGYWKKATFRASLGFIFWFRNLRVFRWRRIFSGPPALEEDEDGKKEADTEADADGSIRQLRSL